MSETFDPTKHLRELRGKGGTAAYLDVKWRLVWLRTEYPHATTLVDHVEISPDIAIFKATVSIPDRGSATDYGSETPRDFGDYIEKAATKALGRALAQLGFGTQFVGFELDENTRIVDSPVERPQQQPDPLAIDPRRPQDRKSAPHPLLAVIRDDQADPKVREKALHNYMQSATTLAQLAECVTQVKESGMPEATRDKARVWHTDRIVKASAPASVAG